MVFSTSDKWLEYRFSLCLVLSQISEKKSVLQKDFLRVGVQILLKAAVIKYICEWEGLKSASPHPEVRLNNVHHFP